MFCGSRSMDGALPSDVQPAISLPGPTVEAEFETNSLEGRHAQIARTQQQSKRDGFKCGTQEAWSALGGLA